MNPTRDFVTVVSGLPRSGTSMMMQALDAGGIPPLTDGQRTADEDNPHGYFELEAVKQIAKDDSFLDGAAGKSVKLIHMLVTRLPARQRFRVLVMRRHIDEIFDSQAKMLERSGKAGGATLPEAMKKVLEKQLLDAIEWLGQQPNIEVLELDYPTLVADPAPSMSRIDRFLGGGMHVEAMTGAVDPSLYRNRQG